MDNLFAQFINTYGVPILYALLTALAGALANAIKALYTKYINDKTKKGSGGKLWRKNMQRTFTIRRRGRRHARHIISFDVDNANVARKSLQQASADLKTYTRGQ